MKTGLKEMKKEYKKVDINKIEVTNQSGIQKQSIIILIYLT